MKLRLIIAGLVIMAATYLWIFPPMPFHGDFNPGILLPAKTDSTWRLAFGSCNNQDYDQSIWGPILAAHPDVWLWLGDNIYQDTDDMAKKEAAYAKQKNHAGYITLRKQAQVIGIYDDHDYAWNGADSTYPMKRQSQKLALDFLEEPDDSPRRNRQGVFIDYRWELAGKIIELILVDTRTFRGKKGPDGDLLGEAQWLWLDEVLRREPAPAVTLFGTSTQVFRENFWKDKWNDFPKSKRRLLKLLRASGRANVLILSGDRHHGEVSVLEDVLAYPLYEVTSSGLTHINTNFWFISGQEKNDFRHGNALGDLNFGVVDVTATLTGARVDFFICDHDGWVRIRGHVH